MNKLILSLLLFPLMAVGQSAKLQFATTNTPTVVSNIVKSLATNVVSQNVPLGPLYTNATVGGFGGWTNTVAGGLGLFFLNNGAFGYGSSPGDYWYGFTNGTISAGNDKWQFAKDGATLNGLSYGLFPAARGPAGAFLSDNGSGVLSWSINGSGLTNLNASNISTGRITLRSALMDSNSASGLEAITLYTGDPNGSPFLFEVTTATNNFDPDSNSGSLSNVPDAQFHMGFVGNANRPSYKYGNEMNWFNPFLPPVLETWWRYSNTNGLFREPLSWDINHESGNIAFTIRSSTLNLKDAAGGNAWLQTSATPSNATLTVNNNTVVALDNTNKWLVTARGNNLIGFTNGGSQNVGSLFGFGTGDNKVILFDGANTAGGTMSLQFGTTTPRSFRINGATSAMEYESATGVFRGFNEYATTMITNQWTTNVPGTAIPIPGNLLFQADSGGGGEGVSMTIRDTSGGSIPLPTIALRTGPSGTTGGTFFGSKATLDAYGIANGLTARGGSATQGVGLSGGHVLDGSSTWGADLLVNSAGKVGIHTNSPQEALHVVGNALVSGSILLPTNYVAANFAPTPGMVKIVPSNGVLYAVSEASTNALW